MVTFKIIENPQSDYEKVYDEFIELYNNSTLTVMEIQKRLGLNSLQYDKSRKRAISEGKLILRKGADKSVVKNYHFQESINRWVVTKQKKGGDKIYVRCYNEEQAQMLVEELKKVDWDKKKLYRIKKKVGL